VDEDRHALFEKLLQQLDLSAAAAQPYFQTATIDRLTVHEQSRRWHFFLKLPSLMPFTAFVDFHNHLQMAFKDIAKVEATLEVDQPELTNRALGDYWKWVVENSGLTSNLVQELCQSQVPGLDEDNRVLLYAQNEVVKDFLTNQALGPLEATYRDAGFPKFNIKVMVDESKSQAKIDEFKARQEKNDAQLAQQAAAAIEKANQKRAAQGDTPAAEGPTQIGKTIKGDQPITRMVDITQEERSVVVEGYVFDKEVRKLRSGRQLLTLKITDYTSSFAVKKFSRGAEDEAQFAGVEEGSWVKVRGSVQEDTYMHDLALNAYDINQVKHATRQDTAPADEKRVELHLHTSMSQMDATNPITDYVSRAKKWGMPALAITDHSDVQGFPAAFNSGSKAGIKMLYGVEANLVDDGVPIGYNSAHEALDGATYVVFDVETTGLSAIYDKVIELSAVKMQHKNVIEQFEEFIDPGFPLSEQTTNLTSITDDMVAGSKSEEEVF